MRLIHAAPGMQGHLPSQTSNADRRQRSSWVSHRSPFPAEQYRGLDKKTPWSLHPATDAPQASIKFILDRLHTSLPKDKSTCYIKYVNVI